ncbi:MAG TPA: haloacid dehalogenase type II [Bryobacteraceae bacterium]
MVEVLQNVKALAFDIFGTVVDWRGSIIVQGVASGIDIGWPEFAERWREGYAPAMDEVRRGVLPWSSIDALHRTILDRLVGEFGLAWGEEEKAHWNLVWHRLAPWPDAVEGLARLRKSYVLATLSNGNMSLLIDLVRHGGLPFDAVFSAELFRHYKPDKEVYLGAAALLDLQPHEVMMVAAHASDLEAAKSCGMRTAYVMRPLESLEVAEGTFDLVVTDFRELAERLTGSV